MTDVPILLEETLKEYLDNNPDAHRADIKQGMLIGILWMHKRLADWVKKAGETEEDSDVLDFIEGIQDDYDKFDGG